MKKTSLYIKHVESGAKMVEFAGYMMPVQYNSALKEHFAVREKLGLFDVSHMGEFLLKGEKALDLLQKISSNDVSSIKDNQAQYGCITNHKGGIIDDFIVYRISSVEYMMVVNASNIEKDWNWLVANNDFGVSLENISEKMSLLAIQGPKSAVAMQCLTDYPLGDIQYYHFAVTEFGGVPNVIVSGTGYTGSGGFEIYLPAEKAAEVWDKIVAAGKPYELELCGLASRDTLRLEKGYCLYGNDINEETTPLEAGLGWVTKLKDRKFNGSDALISQKELGISKKLIAFEINENGIARKGYPICDAKSNQIGEVTSGTISPILKKGIGLGYVNSDYLKNNENVFVSIREKLKKARIVKLPFV